jgi:hypothetical protein
MSDDARPGVRKVSKRDELIASVVRDWFAPMIVQDVIVEDGVSYDDDPVLNITVVVAPGQKVDRRKRLALARELEARIEAARDAFPVTHIMSSQDAQRKREAA